MAAPTHRIYFGPTAQHVAEVVLTEAEVAWAVLCMREGGDVLIVSGETITYRIAGRSIHAVVDIAPVVEPADKPVIRIREVFPNGQRRFELAGSELENPEFPGFVEKLNWTMSEYTKRGLTRTEAFERVRTLDSPFTLEVVDAE